MKITFATAALLAALSMAAAAAAQGSADPRAVPAGSYSVEPAHTRVQFTVNHMGISSYWGDFTGVSGSLSIDPAHPAAAKVAVTIPVASVSTTNAKLDGEIKSPMFLDGTQFPTISFTSTSVTPTGPNTATIVGDLTLHGVTKPVTLMAKFHGGGANPISHKTNIGFDATGAFNRADFGVKTYVPMISDEVDIRIGAAFEKN